MATATATATTLEAKSLLNLLGVEATPDEKQSFEQAESACRAQGFYPGHSVAHHLTLSGFGGIGSR